MRKKEIAGIDRPYTVRDLGLLLYNYIKDEDFENEACLEYFSPYDDEQTKITNTEFIMYAITDFGGNEGIYTTFYIDFGRGQKRIKLLTAKTLSETEDAFVKMHEMSAHVCYWFRKFFCENFDNFTWTGFWVSYVDNDGKEHDCLWCGSLERVAINANRLLKDCPKVYYTECATRKKKEYKI